MGDSRRRRGTSCHGDVEGCRGRLSQGTQKHTRAYVGDIVVNVREKREQPFVFAAARNFY